MGTAICLEIPDNKKNADLIREYYKYKRQKSKEINGTDIIENAAEVERKVNEFHSEGSILIFESVYSSILESMDSDAFYSLFEQEERKNCVYSPIHGDEIKTLINLLEKCKPKLQEMKPEADWNSTLETQQIAICEFALNNNLGIRLSL